ncbi:hypothetical protein PJL18_02977 [Paenarthrobacter nicotinovorans]|nr:hypothetical protein [Paenarthrobacter nicotinovorans]
MARGGVPFLAHRLDRHLGDHVFGVAEVAQHPVRNPQQAVPFALPRRRGGDCKGHAAHVTFQTSGFFSSTGGSICVLMAIRFHTLMVEIARIRPPIWPSSKWVAAAFQISSVTVSGPS